MQEETLFAFTVAENLSDDAVDTDAEWQAQAEALASMCTGKPPWFFLAYSDAGEFC